MTTTITFNPKGHTVTVVSVKGSAWGTVSIDDTKTLAFTVDPAGGFDRSLYAFLGTPVSGPTKSTTSITNDTVTAVFATNGVNPLTGLGVSRYKDAHAGETVHVLLAEAGIFDDGVQTSDAVAPATVITNNSIVAKPRPICGWTDEPAPLELIQGGTVSAAVMAGCGYDITSVEITITDSALNTASGFATLDTRTSTNGYGPETIPVWRASIDVSGLVEGAATVSFVATTEAANTFDSVAFGMPSLPIYIDPATILAINTIYVDSSSTLPTSGTFTVTSGDVITGDTSGAKAVVEEDATNASSIKVTMLTTIDFSADENISGIDSGTAIASGPQTNNWSASPAINDPDNPAHSIKRATDVSGLGHIVKIKSKYTYLVGESDGFGNGTASGRRTIVEPDYEGMFHLIRDPTGKPGGNSDHRNWRNFYRNMVIDMVDSGNIVWHIGSGDPYWGLAENIKIRRPPGSGDPSSRFAGTHDNAGSGTCIVGFDGSAYEPGMTPWWPLNSTGARGFNQIGVILDCHLAGQTWEGDIFYFDANGIDSGNATITATIDRVLGSSAGTHGDLVQCVGGCKNIITFIENPNNGYQGFFCNDRFPSEVLDGWWIRGFVASVDDHVDTGKTFEDSQGPGPFAFHMSCHNMLIENSTGVRSPLLTNDGGINFIPEDNQCDNIFVRNCVFSRIATPGGNGPIPYSTYVNCHTITASVTGYSSLWPGIRCTTSVVPDNYTELFKGPWTDDGVYPNNATSWAAKADGPLDGRIIADDLIGGEYYWEGEAVTVGGAIGFLKTAPAPAPSIKTARGYARFMMRKKIV